MPRRTLWRPLLIPTPELIQRQHEHLRKAQMAKMKLMRREKWIIDRCRGKAVLHLGCTDSPMTADRLATGRLLHQQLLNVSQHLVGIDLDRCALEMLREKAKIPNLYHHNIEDLRTLPLKETFDIILAGEVVEHLDNVGLFFDSCRTLMGEHTVLIVTVPNAYSVKRFLSACFLRTEHVHPDHSAYFSPSTLACVARRHSLRILNLFGYVWENPTVFNRVANLISRASIALLNSPLLADGLIVEFENLSSDSASPNLGASQAALR